MNLHINQKSLLYEKYKEHFDFDYSQFSEKVKELSYQKYQYLLSLYYNHQINDMRRELILLGITV